MFKLIELKNGQIQVSDEALLVKPIRDLYKEDRTKGHDHFLSEMSYLYFMCDPRSDYSYITDLNERAAVVIEQEGLPKNFKPSPKLSLAMAQYEKLTVTTSSLLLADMRFGIDKIRRFFRDFDFEHDVDDSGRPKYTLSSISTTLRQMLPMITELSKAEAALKQELAEVTRTKGGDMNNSIFEDGVDNE